MNVRNANGAGIIGLGVLLFLIAVHWIGAQQKAVEEAPNANTWLKYYGPPEGATVPLDEINPLATPVRPLAPTASNSGTSSIGAGGVFKLRVYPNYFTPFSTGGE
jgi:hypothetical protein